MGAQGIGKAGLSAEDEALLERNLLERSNRVLDQLDQGDLVEAAKELDGLREAIPDYPPAELFETFLRARLAEARARREPVTPSATDTTAADEKLTRAREMIQEGRVDEARELLEQARALNPGNEEVADTLFGVLKGIGLEFYSKGDAAQAVGVWRRALEIRPGDAELLRFLERADSVHRKL